MKIKKPKPAVLALVTRNTGLAAMARSVLLAMNDRLEPECYTSCRDARMAMSRRVPRAILCDWSVDEDNDGLELVKWVRSDDRFFRTAVIVMTSEVDQDHVAMAMDEDADEFLGKPFTSSTLSQALERAIKRRRNPSEYLQVLRQVEVWINKKHYTAAAEILEKAVRLTDKPSSAWFYRGYLAMVTGDLKGALQWYDRGLAVRPNQIGCLFGRAFVLRRLGRKAEHLQALKSLVDTYPSHVNALTELLPLLHREGDFTYGVMCLEHLFKKWRVSEKIASLLDQYALLFLLPAFQRKDQQIIDFFVPILKSFRAGRRGFSYRLLHFLLDADMEREAVLLSLAVRDDFGATEELDIFEAHRLYACGNYQGAADACLRSRRHRGQSLPVQRWLVRALEKLDYPEQLARERETLADMEKEAAADTAKKAAAARPKDQET